MLRRVSINNEDELLFARKDIVRTCLALEDYEIKDREILDLLYEKPYKGDLSTAYLVKDINATITAVYTFCKNELFSLDIHYLELLANYLLRDLAVKGAAISESFASDLLQKSVKFTQLLSVISKESKLEVRARKAFDLVCNSDLFATSNKTLGYLLLCSIYLSSEGCVLVNDGIEVGEDLVFSISEDLKDMEVFA